VILGPGDTNRSSGALFGKVQKGMRFYTKGATGFVDVRDVVDAMIRLMDSDTVNERYVLVSENLSYLDLLTQAALALHVKPPTVEATRFMAGLAWRTDWLLRFFTGKKPAFTRENAKTSLNQSYYSSQKVIKQLGLSFIPIHQSIVETAQWIRTSQR
jgi:nucleoside-diphosphate-sugar epimerase